DPWSRRLVRARFGVPSSLGLTSHASRRFYWPPRDARRRARPGPIALERTVRNFTYMTTMTMNNFARVALVACLTLGAALATAQDRKYILFYGNSFTNAGVPTMVRNIAAAAGHTTPIVVNAAVDGQSLHWHQNSASQM